jgi:hypothetical protein
MKIIMQKILMYFSANVQKGLANLQSLKEVCAFMEEIYVLFELKY